jgi:hypothetical protein
MNYSQLGWQEQGFYLVILKAISNYGADKQKGLLPPAKDL